MTGPDDDFGGGYEDYEPSPYNGDSVGDEFDTFGPEEVDSDDEPSDDEVAEWEQAEDAGLDAMMEDRISGLSGFEAD